MLASSFSGADVNQPASLGVPALVGSIERPVDAQLDTKAQVLHQWAERNPNFVSGSSRQAVLCADEADMTIYRAARHYSQRGFRALVISPDSDFNYIPSSVDVFATLRFVKYRPDTRRASGIPWTLLNNVSLHSHTPKWTWATDFARVAAVMLSGHDYVPGGVSNIGLTRLHQSQVLSSVSRTV